MQRLSAAADDRFAVRVFVIVLAIWMLLPIALHQYSATDTTPFVVAGRLVRSGNTADIYLDKNGDVAPRFRAEACPGADPRCESAPFVAPPTALPLAVPLGYLSIRGAAFVVRMLDAIALVLTMALLWQRLADRGPTTRRAIAISAVLLTPLVVVTLDMGNNSPLIVLLVAAVAVERVRHPAAEVGLGVGIAMAAALKLFPAALLLVALAQRRFRVVAGGVAGIVVLSGVTASIAPTSLYADFWQTTSRWSDRVAIGWFNGSIEASAREYSGSGWPVVVWALRAIIVVAAIRLYPRVPARALWPLAPFLLITVFPQVWVYYLFFAVVATCVLVEATGRLGLLPAVAAVSSAPAIAQRLSMHAAWVYTGSVLTLLVIVAYALPERSRADEPTMIS
ncbi:MAG: hypothetical protein QOD92_1446 [Acidimicrobiaceae bacterium]